MSSPIWIPGRVALAKPRQRGVRLNYHAFQKGSVRAAWGFQEAAGGTLRDLTAHDNDLTTLNTPTWVYARGIGWGLQFASASSQWANLGGGAQSVDTPSLDITSGDGLGILCLCRVDALPVGVTTKGVVTKNKHSSGAPTSAPYVLQI